MKNLLSKFSKYMNTPFATKEATPALTEKQINRAKIIADLKNQNPFKGKSTNEIIEEIHHSFYSEVDKLLADAKIANSLDTDKQDLIDKCARLKALGFTNTKEVVEAEMEITRLHQLEQENIRKKNLIEAINYFSFKYPNYKFITEDSVKLICEKYNLVYGSIERYIGTVPDKNLKQIEEFQIHENDHCYFEESGSHHYFTGMPEVNRRVFYDKEIADKKKEDKMKVSLEYRHLMHLSRSNYFEREGKSPLEIAAPVKDFDMQGMAVVNSKICKIEIPDPVVLFPVVFKAQKHYLIVTAWGLEASDDLVVNQNMN